jgi:hypothetical protein
MFETFSGVTANQGDCLLNLVGMTGNGALDVENQPTFLVQWTGLTPCGSSTCSGGCCSGGACLAGNQPATGCITNGGTCAASCPSGNVCSGGACVSGACVPIPKSTACAGMTCGFASDNCGGQYSCGTCPSGTTCGKCEPGVCHTNTRCD